MTKISRFTGNMNRHASVLWSARLRQFRCPIILLTIEVLWWRLVTYLSALRCTCSSWVIFSLVYVSHTGQAYSSDGRTRDLYACSLNVAELILIFLQKNPSVVFAFVIILFIWLSHLRSDCIVAPRYLAWSAC